MSAFLAPLRRHVLFVGFSCLRELYFLVAEHMAVIHIALLFCWGVLCCTFVCVYDYNMAGHIEHICLPVHLSEMILYMRPLGGVPVT